MSNNPLISVVIPAYNHENYVQGAIRSVIAQTYQNLELIVVDDGSHDNTWTKIQEMADACKSRFSNVILIRKENGGIISSLNLAIERMSGEYVYTMASDDLAKPDAIETLYDFAHKNPEYGMVVGDDDIIDSDGARTYWDIDRNCVPADQAVYKTFGEYLKKMRPEIDFNTDDFGTYPSLLRGNYVPNGYLIRTDLLRQIGGYRPGMLEDWHMAMQLAKITKIKYIDRVLFSYRWHETNTIKQIDRVLPQEIRSMAYERDYVYKNYPELVDFYKKRAVSLLIRREFRIFGLSVLKKKVNVLDSKYYVFGIRVWKKSN